MKNVYEENYRITANMVNSDDYLKISSVLDMSQRIAGNHADVLGVGFGNFYKKGLIWVVVRNYVEVVKQIRDPRECRLVTYALKPRFVEFPRDVEVHVDGELAYKIRQIWMILDYKNNKVIAPSEVVDIASDKEGLFKERIKRISMIDKGILKFEGKSTVTYSMIDHNKHMNNTRYLDLFFDIFGGKKKQFTICQAEYVKQGFLGDELSLYSYEEGDNIHFYVYRKDDLLFYSKIQY